MQALAKIAVKLWTAADAEEMLAERTGTRFAVVTRTEGAARRLAVAALDLRAGDEVVVAPGTARDVLAGILDAGALPVFADVAAADGCLTSVSVAAARTSATRAVLVPHAHGAGAQVADLVTDHAVRVVEDCTDAFLAETPDGRPAGSTGDLAFFTFPADGYGVVVTNDHSTATRLRHLRDAGFPPPTLGVRRGLTDGEAEVLRQRVEVLEAQVAVRRSDAEPLRDELSDLAGLAFPRDLARHALPVLPLLIDPRVAGAGNGDYAAALTAAGVAADVGTQPLYRVPGTGNCFRRAAPQVRYGPGWCPVAEDRVARTLVLLHWGPDPADLARAIRTAHRAIA
ncbi:DegT/DnrJ/EryC1/StrS family aminotransferase [Kribbella sp. GL6]|uniref:DegT/DnrJ/EryC1/StrS family aminotransferase n=1 Tax=Kribbella sp. GL6 TaxID=3419765 RepID=UPI003D0815D0